MTVQDVGLEPRRKRDHESAADPPPKAGASPLLVPLRPVGLLQELEGRWREELQAVSLIAEIEASDDDVKRALRALGQLYNDSWDTDNQYRLLRRRYPACLVVSLAGIGCIEYSHGTYWPRVWEHAGIEPGQAGKDDWANAFGFALDRFKLARFKNLPHRYLGEILMHAGVPEFCLEDLFNLMLQRQDRDPGLTAAAFLAWASSPHYTTRLNGLDVPVRRFLQSGKDYAEDFIDRCLELLDRLREPGFEADGLRLPARVIERARILAEDGRIDLRKYRTRADKARMARENPRFLLEPFGRGLVVQLPAVDDAPSGQVAWQIKADDTAKTIVSSSPWPTERGVAPAVAFSVDRPVRKVHAANSHTGQHTELDLVDANDPLLVFTEEGRLVPATSAVAPEPIWLLSPEPSELSGGDVKVDGDWSELEEMPAPHGWNGWRLRRIDVSKARAIRCGSGAWRSVHQSRRARLEGMSPLAGVQVAGGESVFSQAPKVELPADAGTATGWSIRVRRPGAAVTLSTSDVAITKDTVVDPWAEIARPLVGAYEVSARGPLGRGFSRTLHIVEGLLTESYPAWRSIGPRGLIPGRVRIWGACPGLHFDAAVVELGPNEPTARFHVSGPDGSTTVEITPPHMAVRLDLSPTESWSVHPLCLSTDDLGEQPLHVRLPGAIAAKLVVRSMAEDLQEIESASTRGRAEATFDLSRLVDTVRRAGTAQLEVEFKLDVEFRTLRYPVARCRPRSLAENVTLDDTGRLVLQGASVTDGLVAGVYQVYAPWRPPVAVPVTAEAMTATLPVALIHGGPLEVALRIEDPWVPEPWPAWPASRDVFKIPGRPLMAHGSDPGENQLSKVLAGFDGHPVPESVSYAAALYARHDDLRRYPQIPSARDVAAAVLAHHPADFLRWIATGSGVAATVEAPLIHAGLALLPPARYLDEGQDLTLWAIAPIAAILASSHTLSQMDDAMIERVVDLCGPIARDLLLGEGDPAGGAGAFDENAQRLARMPAEQLDALWSAASVVPQGLLSVDERTAAARQLFDARERNGMKQLSFRASRISKEIKLLVAESRGTSMANTIEARGLAEGWRALSGYSLALAFIARLAARDPARFGGYARTRIADHAVLARHAPRLATVDLILAELHLHGTDLA